MTVYRGSTSQGWQPNFSWILSFGQLFTHKRYGATSTDQFLVLCRLPEIGVFWSHNSYTELWTVKGIFWNFRKIRHRKNYSILTWNFRKIIWLHSYISYWNLMSKFCKIRAVRFFWDFKNYFFQCRYFDNENSSISSGAGGYRAEFQFMQMLSWFVNSTVWLAKTCFNLLFFVFCRPFNRILFSFYFVFGFVISELVNLRYRTLNTFFNFNRVGFF